jgi:hypothetical protein
VRRDPLTMTEVARLFRDELKTRYHPPSEAQLTVLLFNLSGRIARFDLEAIAALGPLSQAAADFSHYGWRTYQAIEALAAIRPDWLTEMPVVVRISSALREAVEEGLLEPMPPQRSRGRGRPSLGTLHLLAYFVATAVQSSLQEANPSHKFSLTTECGPVVRIGAKLFAQLRGQRVIQPTTFRSQVQKGHWLRTKLERSMVKNSSD